MQIVNKVAKTPQMTKTADVYLGIFSEQITVQMPITKPAIWPAICRIAFDKIEGSGKVNSLANPTPHGKTGKMQMPSKVDMVPTKYLSPPPSISEYKKTPADSVLLKAIILKKTKYLDVLSRRQPVIIDDKIPQTMMRMPTIVMYST